MPPMKKVMLRGQLHHSYAVDNQHAYLWPRRTGNWLVDSCQWYLLQETDKDDGVWMLVLAIAGAALITEALYNHVYVPNRYGISQQSVMDAVTKHDEKLAAHGHIVALQHMNEIHMKLDDAKADPEVSNAIYDLAGSAQIADTLRGRQALSEKYHHLKIEKDGVLINASDLERADALAARIQHNGQKYLDSSQFHFVRPSQVRAGSLVETSDVVLVSSSELILNAIKKTKKSASQLENVKEAIKLRSFEKFARIEAVLGSIDALEENTDYEDDGYNRLVGAETAKSLSNIDITVIDRAALEFAGSGQPVENNSDAINSAYRIGLAQAMNIDLKLTEPQYSLDFSRELRSKIDSSEPSDLSAAYQQSVDPILRHQALKVAERVSVLLENCKSNPQMATNVLGFLSKEVLPESLSALIDPSLPGEFSKAAFADTLFNELHCGRQFGQTFKNFADIATDTAYHKIIEDEFRAQNYSPGTDFLDLHECSKAIIDALSRDHGKTMVSAETLSSYLESGKNNKVCELTDKDSQFVKTCALLREIDRGGVLLQDREILQQLQFSKCENYDLQQFSEELDSVLMEKTGTSPEELHLLHQKIDSDPETAFVLGCEYLLGSVEKHYSAYLNDILGKYGSEGDLKTDCSANPGTGLSPVDHVLDAAKHSLQGHAAIFREKMLGLLAKTDLTKTAYQGGISIVNTSREETSAWICDQVSAASIVEGNDYVDTCIGQDQENVLAAYAVLESRINVMRELNKDDRYLNSRQYAIQQAAEKNPALAAEVVGKVYKRYQKLEELGQKIAEDALRDPKKCHRYPARIEEYQRYVQESITNSKVDINGHTFTMDEVLNHLLNPSLLRVQEEWMRAGRRTADWVHTLKRVGSLSTDTVARLQHQGILSTESLQDIEKARSGYISKKVEATINKHEVRRQELFNSLQHNDAKNDNIRNSIKLLETENGALDNDDTQQKINALNGQMVALINESREIDNELAQVASAIDRLNEFREAGCVSKCQKECHDIAEMIAKIPDNAPLEDVKKLCEQQFSSPSKSGGASIHIVKLATSLARYGVYNVNALLQVPQYINQLGCQTKRKIMSLFNVVNIVGIERFSDRMFAGSMSEFAKMTRLVVTAQTPDEAGKVANAIRHDLVTAAYESAKGRPVSKDTMLATQEQTESAERIVNRTNSGAYYRSSKSR